MTTCELCGIRDAIHTLPQEGALDDLEICDDCAVGRRDKIADSAEVER